MDGTLSVVVVRALFATLEQAGVEVAPLAREFGLTPELLDDPETRVSASAAFALIEKAPELMGDPLFCLRAAEHVPMGALEVLDFVTRSSPTMGEALDRTVRYYALIDDRTELTLETRGAIARLIGKNCTTPPAPRPATELLFGLVLARGRQLTGVSCPLKEVRFLQTPPADPSAHRDFFGVPVYFEQSRDELVFDASWLSAPCLDRDPALARFFDRHAQSIVERLPGPTRFVDEVHEAIAAGFQGVQPTLAETAKRLGTSARTLQRRLSDAGTSYAELIDQVRKKLALDLLSDPNVGIGEVGYLLGFSDPSAFYRAFRRWTGSTPADYRKQPAYLLRRN